MAENKRPVAVAGVGALLAAFGAWAAHSAGLFDDFLRNFGDDIARNTDDVGRGADDIGRVGDDLGRIPAEVSIAKNTFTELRNGDATDKVVVSAACAVMKRELDDSTSHDVLVDQIYAELGPRYAQTTLSGRLISSTVDKLANAMVVAEINGGMARYYVVYCGL